MKSINLLNIKKQLLILGLSIALKSSIIAQVSDFKMRNYLYRTQGMRALAFNANSYASTLSNKLNFSLTPGASFFKQYSTDTRQLTIWNYTSLGFSKQASDPIPAIPGVTNITAQREVKYMINNNCSWVKRQYNDNKYFEFGSSSTFGFGNSAYKHEQRKLFLLGLNPNVGVGIGRLEYVSNAQMALFILEDLKEAGKIKGSVSADKVYQFTELVTELYNTRIFDYRKRRNYETNKIDSFLVANKIISSNDFTVYNIIADNWNYAIQPNAIEASYFYSGTLSVNYSPVSDRINVFGVLNQASRFNGQRTSLSLILPSTISNTMSGTTMFPGMPGNFINVPGLNGAGALGSAPLDSIQKNIITTQMGYNVIGRYENCLAIDLHRQQNFSFYFDQYSLTNENNVSFKTNKADSSFSTKYNSTTIGGNYQYCYYPNSRTNINANASMSYSLLKNKSTGQSIANKSNALNVGLSLYVNYFINYNSRINSTISYGVSPLGSTGAFRNNNLSFSLSYINYIF